MTRATPPLYLQVYNSMKRDVMEGRYPSDSPMPNHIELSKQFEVSDITMRRALGKLVDEGLIIRRRGKGTFANPKGEIQQNPANSSSKVSKSPLKIIYFGISRLNQSIHNLQFYLNLIRGIDDYCKTHDIQFRIWEYRSDSDLLLEESSGLILMPTPAVTDDEIMEWKKKHIRMLVAHFYYPHLQIPYVIVDNLTGGFLATQHLLGLGHRRIGIILTGKSSLDLNQEFSLRLQGYKLALSQHEIPFDESLVQIIPGQRELEEMGEQGAEKLMSLPNPPTAIFATSDHKAFGCMRALRKLGLSIPEDISVIGYDDLPLGDYTIPRLTSINQNTYLMGKRAAEIVASPRAWSEEKALWKDEIVPSLVVRESTAPPREH